MFDVRKLVIDLFVQELRNAYQQTYNQIEPQYPNLLEWTGRLALELISNSDSLYHDYEHTIMVAMVGQEILKGKHLREGGVTPRDWLHYMLALLCHDIGYVRGVCRNDKPGEYATGLKDETVKVSMDGTDAVLTPFHVDRSKLFVCERFGKSLNNLVDFELICNYIEMTRFPVPKDEFHQDTKGYPGLVRAADFIGQLGDINYLLKIPALFYEFEETGVNETKTKYKSPGDMKRNFTKFYWEVVRQYIQIALHYLDATREGKLWIANLQSHVFKVEHEII